MSTQFALEVYAVVPVLSLAPMLNVFVGLAGISDADFVNLIEVIVFEFMLCAVKVSANNV